MKKGNKKRAARTDGRQSAWLLMVLVVVFAFLALFVGPASAITLIPQLGWWHKDDLIGPVQSGYGGRYKAPFSVYIPTNLYPTEVDETYLPGSFCSDLAKDINGTCPSARLAEVQRSFVVPSSGLSLKTWNNTIALSDDDRVPRRMVYKQMTESIYGTLMPYTVGNAAVTVPNYVLSSFASLVRQLAFPDASTGSPTIGEAFTFEISANDAAPLAPLVGANCNDSVSGIFVRDYTYDSDESTPYPGTLREATTSLDIRSKWDEERLKEHLNGTELAWKDMTTATGNPVLLGLLRHGNNVTVCTVQSYWTPTSQWIVSTSSYEVATNFTFEFTEADLRQLNSGNYVNSMYGYPYSRNTHLIHSQESWANTLNAVNGTN